MRHWEHSSLVYPQVERAGIASRAVSRGLSVLFHGAGSLRQAAYDRGWFTTHKLPGAVISVGNIAVGGTGKTPTVVALLDHLLKQGKRPAVLTRGYGSGLGKRDWILLLGGRQLGGNCKPAALPDEARLQSAAFPGVPVIAGASRFRAASEFLRTTEAGAAPTHWILDDGFQHRGIKRDLDLVLLDRGNPFGNFSVLPYGMLREPARSLVRADHILLTGSGTPLPGLESELKSFAPDVPVSLAMQVAHPLRRDISDSLDFSPSLHTPALVVAGIARPERFLRNLEEECVQIGACLTPGDHAPLRLPELERLAESVRSVIVTSKDYWRSPEVFRALKIPVFIKNMEIKLPESLLAALP